MKKFFTFALICCLIFSSSFSVYAVDWSTTDQSNLANASSRLNTISTKLTNIYNKINDIFDTLGYDGSSIGTIVGTWLPTIHARLQDILQGVIDPAINPIVGFLGSIDVVNGTTVRTPYLFYNGKSAANWLYDIASSISGNFPLTSNLYGINTTSSNLISFTSNNLAQLLNNYLSRDYQGLHSTINTSAIGQLTYYDPTTGNPINYNYRSTDDLIRILLSKTNQSLSSFSAGYPVQQKFTNWMDLSDVNYSPTSSINGLYAYLSNIQTPVARLSYVLASDERIEAQEAAAANEETVVNNFIDSSGSGSASPSDISSVSGLSSGFKDNISTDANVSGIWNIFNSDNFGWFSQETADQLDTSSSGKKTLRSSGYYPTPLLDQQTEDILKYIGGDNND